MDVMSAVSKQCLVCLVQVALRNLKFPCWKSTQQSWAQNLPFHSYTTLHRLHWIWQRSRSVCRWPLYTSICQSKLSCEIVTAWLLQAVQLIMPSTSQGPRNEAKVPPSNSHNLCTYFYVIDAYWPLRHPRKNLTWTLCIHFFISTEMFLTTSAERSVLSWWWTLILLPVE